MTLLIRKDTKMLKINNQIKKSLSVPHLKRCGLCGTSGCSEKSDSFKETVCTLKGAVYFSDIKELNLEEAILYLKAEVSLPNLK